MQSEDSKLDAAEGSGDLREAFALLISRHAELSHSVENEEHTTSIEQKTQFSELIGHFIEAYKRDREQQETTAVDFNILEVLRLTDDERRHSMVLAWLLDHDVDCHGTHAQGLLGFRLFLSEFDLPEEYATSLYWVNRELSGDESIVDIEIAARGKFLIHIENKILASEGTDQTNREWADIKRRAAELGIDVDQPNAPVHALFLTPSGKPPENDNFKAISWHRIVSVLLAFAEKAKPVEVKLFAAHHAKTVERFVVVKRPKKE